MEEIRKITVKEINRRCPKCGIGYLKCIDYNKIRLTLSYTHSCTHCKRTTQVRFKRYPIISKK